MMAQSALPFYAIPFTIGLQVRMSVTRFSALLTHACRSTVLPHVGSGKDGGRARLLSEGQISAAQRTWAEDLAAGSRPL